MVLDMAGRRLILMLCTILLVLIKCTDTQNDPNGTQPSSGDTNNTPKASSPPTSHPLTTYIPLNPTTVTHATDNQSSPLASTTATLTPKPVILSNSTGLEKSENFRYSNASTSHPASTTPSTSIPLNPTSVTHCDVKISLTKETITRTSAHFKWEVHSRKCPNLLNEQEYKNKCEYVCEYKATHENKYQSVKNKSSECALTNLMPFTKYNFVLKLRCYGNDVKGSKLERAHMTEPGVPEGKIIVSTKPISSNGFKITCSFHGKRNGNIEKYSAKIIDRHNSIQQLKYKEKCEFEFTDLPYLTTYNLTVQVHNEWFSSRRSVPITLSTGYVKESGTHMTKMEVEQFCLANNPSTR